MAILRVAHMGHPVLRYPAELVTDLDDPAVHRLAADMQETLEHITANGVAAPQVYVPILSALLFTALRRRRYRQVRDGKPFLGR